MEWKTYYVVVRPNQDGTVAVVNENNSLKDSRYWLNYIGEPFDALCLTSANPKYTGSGDPTYSCHLIARAKTEYNESAWKKKVFTNGESTTPKFVSFSETKVNPSSPSKVASSSIPETEILQLADGSPRSLTLDQIKSILTYNKKNMKIILSEPTKWIDWESALTLMTKDVHVIGISADPKWPLTVTLNPATGKGENMNYAEEMKFLVRV